MDTKNLFDKEGRIYMGSKKEIKNCTIGIFGVNYDGTTSFKPGTRFGPEAIRNVSQSLETFCPKLDKDLSNISYIDFGSLIIDLNSAEGVIEKVNGIINSEIVLSKPILKALSIKEIKSTLCHEMIHAWIDRTLMIKESHGSNFLKKMHEINSQQNDFKISVRHDFPVIRNKLKYQGICINCGESYLYRKRVKNIACKKCCNLFFNGNWNEKCLIVFDGFNLL